jgi:hypothetical protein
MKKSNFDMEEEEPGFFKRHGVVLAVVAIAAGIGGSFFMKKGNGGGSAPRTEQKIVMVMPPMPLPPPPPPPPPPPKEPPPEDKKMVEQNPVAEPDKAPEPKVAEPPKEASAALGTNVQGNGPSDGFGLGSSGNGWFGGKGGGNGGRMGGKYDAYAYETQKKIQQVLSQDPKTKHAKFRGELRVWEDNTGRVIRTKFSGSADDPSVKDEIKSTIASLSFNGPPSDMPMPLVIRLTATRP